MILSLPSLSLLLLSSLSQEPADPVPLKTTGALSPRNQLHPAAPLTTQVWTELDLSSILEQISRHAGAKRGRLALLGAGGHATMGRLSRGVSSELQRSSTISSRQSWARGQTDITFFREPMLRIQVAQTVDQARNEFDLVKQATVLLVDTESEIIETQLATNLTYPDFYGGDSGPFDIDSIADTDDDEWLDCPVAEWTLEDILKADQIVQMLLRVYEWASSLAVQNCAPLLAEIGSDINASALEPFSSNIQNAVEVTRAKTAIDHAGRKSYAFRLSETKFPVLRLLRKKENELRQRGIASRKGHEQQITELQQELTQQEEIIRRALAVDIARYRTEIDRSLSIVARLDTLLARAAFGVAHSCVFPIVQSSGKICVNGFRHPLMKSEGTVPVDLRLSGLGRERALIISGPNGGGKTAAMKSFGLAAVFVKLGIPIPASPQPDNGPVRVDLFERIHVSIGDQQSLVDGQSTFMGILSEYSRLIDEAKAMSDMSISNLVLLDEIGSGTDQNAGGAIVQAVLEKLNSFPYTYLVATTHCPRLKTLSFEDSNFNCASVLLSTSTETLTRMPTYQLQYGVIGESYALAAASRCVPHLSNDVIERASSLIETENQDTAYLRALGNSMQRQLHIVENASLKAEEHLSWSIQCQTALRRVALAYERHFGLLEKRLDQYYTDAKGSQDSVELLGNVLSEVRAVRKSVKTEAEFLREQGLRPVPHDYIFSDNETVTVIAEGEWNGEMAKVCPGTKATGGSGASQDDVLVIPCLMPWLSGIEDDDATKNPQVLVFKKSELAIWDYESIYGDYDDEQAVASISDSKRRLNRVLATLGSSSNTGDKRDKDSRKNESKDNSDRFRSARERKASRKNRKKRRI